MDGKKEHTEELVNNDEKTGDTEDDSNTTSTWGGKDRENRKEIKPSNGQENPKNRDIDEELVLAEEAAKENTTEEKKNDDTEEEHTKDSNLNTTGYTW